MVILGLGSNIGDRLAHLRKAFAEIKKIPGCRILQVSPIYFSDALLPDCAPPTWDQPYLNLAIRLETDDDPIGFLGQLKKIEWSIGRKPEIRHWGPRVIDIDILAWDDLVLRSDPLTVPHDRLHERPFALWPLADVAPLWCFPLTGPYQGKTAAELSEQWGSRFTGEAPFHTRQLQQRIDTPTLVGILNVTPDSFSDGGKFLNVESSLQEADKLVQSGAEVIDIGAESTAPRANPITHEQEWLRLEPVLLAIKGAQAKFLIPPKISIDTRHAQTAEKAIALGVDWINDVSGLDQPRMRALLSKEKMDCIIMHHLSLPERRNHVLERSKDSVKAVYEWGEKRLEELEKEGFSRERIIFDPGIGFGKMAEQSFILLKQVNFFKKLGTRLLVGHSRKTFLSLFTNEDFAKRDIETTVLSLYLAHQEIDYLRVHNVEFSARALKVDAAL